MPGRERARSNLTAPGGNGSAVNGGGRERVAHIQRARMIAAMAEVCGEHGAANITVAHVVNHAGVSRRTFYELFEDREDCFLAAFDDAATQACERVTRAYASEPPGWSRRIRAALVELLGVIDEQPATARLLVVESLGGGHRALERRTRLVNRMIAAVDAGRGEPNAAKSHATALTAEGVVGAVLAVIHGRLVQGSPEPLTGLANQLMAMIVLPYLGSAAARRELDRPAATKTGSPQPVSSNPLKEIHMRLTYRTVQVLVAIGLRPGASNRAVGEAAGILDQGQISKLLARLERLGLIANAGARAARGEPNAWTLTTRGQAVHATLRS